MGFGAPGWKGFRLAVSMGPCRKEGAILIHKAIFLRSSLWEYGGVPGGKTQNVCPLRLQPHIVYHSHYPTLSLQKFIKITISWSYHLWLQQFLLQLSRSHLGLFVCTHLSIFWVSGLPCNPSSPMGKRKIIDFQFAKYFLIVRMGVWTYNCISFCGCLLYIPNLSTSTLNISLVQVKCRKLTFLHVPFPIYDVIVLNISYTYI